MKKRVRHKKRANGAKRKANRPPKWLRCVNHPDHNSLNVCPTCEIGYCLECRGDVCPACDSFRIKIKDYKQELEFEEIRNRPLGAELRTIFLYPVQSPLGFILLALFVGVFGLLADFSFYGELLSSGVVAWYAFTGLKLVASGKWKFQTPEFEDISSIRLPLALSSTVAIVCLVPQLLAIGMINKRDSSSGVFSGLGDSPTSIASELGVGSDVLNPNSLLDIKAEVDRSVESDVSKMMANLDNLQSRDKKTRDKALLGLKQTSEANTLANAGAATLNSERHRAVKSINPFNSLPLLLAWLVGTLYMPAALIIAALSENIWAIANPMLGFKTVARMGSMYWQAAGIFLLLALAQNFSFSILEPIPVLGNIAMAFVTTYITLAQGCLLGFACFKRGREIGWEW